MELCPRCNCNKIHPTTDKDGFAVYCCSFCKAIFDKPLTQDPNIEGDINITDLITILNRFEDKTLPIKFNVTDKEGFLCAHAIEINEHEEIYHPKYVGIDITLK